MDSNTPAAANSLFQTTSSALDGSAPTLSLTVLVCVFAIPVVAFALWGDYFERRVRHDRLRGELDFAAESFLLNSAGLVVFILQVVNFFSLRPYQQENEGTSVLLFVGALIAQAMVHLATNRKLEMEAALENEEIFGSDAEDAADDLEDEPVFRPHPQQSARLPSERTARPSTGREWSTTIWLASMLSGYISFAGVCGLAAIILATKLEASPLITAIFGVFGTGLGIIAGLSVVYALAPITVRRLFDVSPLEDPDTLQIFRESFARAGIPCPQVYVLHHAELQTHNVMIAGFTHGRGPFKPAVYITQALIADRLASVRALSPIPRSVSEKAFHDAELRAILLHEVAHASLHHLRKRFLLTASTVVTGLTAGTLGWAVSRLFLPAGLSELIQLAIAAAVVFVPFSRVHRLVYQQELEADLYAVIELGARPEAMISALEKLDALNGRDPGASLGSHPSTLKRVSELQQLVPAHASSTKEDAPAKDDESRAA